MTAGPDPADVISGPARAADLLLPDACPGLRAAGPRRRPSVAARRGGRARRPGSEGLAAVPATARWNHSPGCARRVTVGKLPHRSVKPLLHGWEW